MLYKFQLIFYFLYYNSEMPTADNSQTTRTKILAGKELNTFRRLNPYMPQGGRYPFLQKELGLYSIYLYMYIYIE